MDLVACSALAAASLACQGLADVDRDGGNLVGATSLSFLTVAQSGERKTACDRRMRRALTQWQEEKERELTPAVQAAERRLKLWQARQDGILARIKKLAGSLKPEDREELEKLESLLLSTERDRPVVPPLPLLFYENVTPESLTNRLAANWPSASLWSDEAGIVVGSHAMSEDSALRFLALLNELWDARTVDRWRETRACATIKGRRFTVFLMMQRRRSPASWQPATASPAASAPSPGSSWRGPNRPWAPGPIARATWDCPELCRFDNRLRDLLNLPLPLDPDGGLDPPALELSPDAFAIWRQYHDEAEAELAASGELVDIPDFASKSAEQAARLAAVMHLVEHGPTGAISAHTTGAAAAIAAWHPGEARRIFGMIGSAGEKGDAQVLLDWLRDQQEPRTLGDVLRLGPYRVRDKKRRDGAMAVLTDHHLVRVEKAGGKAVIVVNPGLVR